MDKSHLAVPVIRSSHETIVDGAWSHSTHVEVGRSITQEPDPEWSFTDAAGHTHRWEGEAVPTLETHNLCSKVCRRKRWLAKLLRRPYACTCPTVTVCAVCHEPVAPLRRDVVLIATGRTEFRASVTLHADAALYEAMMSGESVRLEQFFPHIEGEAIIQEQGWATGLNDPETMTLDLLGVGTIKMREE
jgi:hypothetical protein